MKTTEKVAPRVADSSAPSKPKHRSPNHPLVDLEKAIELATKIQKKYGTHDVPLNLIHKEWGYKEWGGVPDQLVAALKAYRLIKVTGSGKARKATLTDAGDRITRKAPDCQALVRVAARAPAIHKEILDHYKDKGLPDDQILRQHLVWGRPEGQRFNEDAVDGFIARFRKSLKVAGEDQSDIIEGHDDGDGAGEPVKVGDHIQWTSDGVDQFFRPMPVTRIVDGHVFVEDSQTGIPMSEVTVVDAPAQAVVLSKTSPQFKATGQMTRELPITLPSLQVAILKVACPMSEEDYEALSNALELFRNALTKKPDSQPAS